MKWGSKRYGWLLGESLIIVLGVLVALAVDRAMQGVDQAALERTVLENLLQDLEEADSVVEEAHTWAVLRDDWGRDLLAILEGEDPPARDFQMVVVGMEFVALHYPIRIPRDTWDDLLGTAQLGMVTNSDLRQAVSRFYRSAELMVNYTDGWTEIGRAYENDLRHILPARWRLEVRALWLNGGPFPSASAPIFQSLPPLDELQARIRDWPDLEGNLSDVLMGTTSAVATYSELKAELESVILTVQAELDAL